jgi:hypothetical protein
MPVFAALVVGKVALYRPLQAPAVGKVAPAGDKVLYRPLEQISVQISSRITRENAKKSSKRTN